MKTFAAKEQRSAPAVRKTRPYVHHPMGSVQQVQRMEIRRILRSTGVQAKLTIGQPNDKYEQEADRVADQVMAMPDPKLQRQPEPEEEEEILQTKPLADQITPLIQRQEEPPEEEEETAQAKGDGGPTTASSTVESGINSMRGGGQPLPESARAYFEPRFSQARVHRDARAAQAAQAVNARAFTVGRDVVFGAAEYSPETGEGRRLLAHELTHVVQQSGSDGIRVGQDNEKRGLSPVSGAKCRAEPLVPNHETMQIRRVPANDARENSASPIVNEVLRSPSQPLDASIRTSFEPRFGRDFSRVRTHTDARAVEVSQALGAEAFTYGNHIYFNERRFAPNHIEGKRLLAHELAHVSQQNTAGSPNLIQRRLLLTGAQADIDDFIAMSETASGLILTRDPATNEVTAVGSSLTPATSPTFATELTRIMDDPIQHAEIHVGRDQPGVDIGAFPVPRDLTGGGVQNVDMDDVNAFEAGAPGIGVADLLHEIVENYEAHATAPVAGVDLFPAAHEAGLEVEANVATDIVGAGRRVAQANEQIGSNIVRIAEDYDAYYVLSDLTVTPATSSFTRSNVSFAPKIAVRAATVDSFVTGSDVVPGAGAATVAAVVGDLAANPLATVRIEGFTDNVGTQANNLDLGRRRALIAARELVAAGVDGGRIELAPRGETGFVAPNNTEANRAQNRRVLFTVTRPGP